MTQNYGPIIGSGAAKLESSRVAPLVALARNYESLQPEDYKPFLETNGWTANQTQARDLKRAIGDLDALLMPWYTPEVVHAMNANQMTMQASSLQMRPHPSNQLPDARGKIRKYLNVRGQPLSLGLHPSTPSEWFMKPVQRMTVVEGLLKADAALSAWLMAVGVHESDLQTLPDETFAGARIRLQRIMENIPAEERMLFVAFVGVGTWHRNPEWNSLRLDGASVRVGFDGDIATNPNVHRQAVELKTFLTDTKKAEVAFFDLTSERDEFGKRMGVDDYLAHDHTWDDLDSLLVSELPPRPRSDDPSQKYRMDEKTCTLQEKKVTKDDDGNDIVTWETKAGLMARVVSISERREVLQEEEESGRYAEGVSPLLFESECVIEVSWINPAGEKVSSRIEGPSKLLATEPKRWSEKNQEAGIPADVLAHPSWPPTCQGFLEAMKSCRPEDIIHESAWTHQGWVPRRDGRPPVFLIGNQVITADGFGDQKIARCETGMELSDSFGVALPDNDEQARQDLREYVQKYMACWSDPRNSFLVMAAAARPAVPKRCRTTVLLTGPSGLGKSFTTAAIFYPWQASPGRWTTNQLPGSAGDTSASTEIALSKNVMHASDDAAPSAYGNSADQALENLSLNIRNVFNGTGKGRATQTMGAQKTLRPRAQFIASAEAAPLDNQSVMNRLVHIEVFKGFLVPEHEPTNELKRWAKTSEVASRVTGRAIQMVAREIEENGWESTVAKWDAVYSDDRADTADFIARQTNAKESDAQRQSENIAEMLLGMELLKDLAADLGMEDETREFFEKMYVGIQEVGVEGYQENARFDLGGMYLRDIRNILSTGQAHITSAGDPGVPLKADNVWVKTQSDANMYNQQLGWSLTGDPDRPAVPNGSNIGYLLGLRKQANDPNNGRPVVLLVDGAFSVVQRYGTKRNGLNSKAAWEALWKSSLTVPEELGWNRKKRSGKKLDHRVRVMVDGTILEGIPVFLDELLGTKGEADHQG